MPTEAEIIKAALHNTQAGPIVASIVRPVLEAGGSVEDVLVLTESVLMGVCLFAVKLGGDNKVLDVIVERVRERLAQVRLGSVEPEGQA